MNGNKKKYYLGSKKKVRWLFGFGNTGDKEYEVVLVLSLLTGKKVAETPLNFKLLFEKTLFNR
jgi:hypothetical protein